MKSIIESGTIQNVLGEGAPFGKYICIECWNKGNLKFLIDTEGERRCRLILKIRMC